MHNECARCSGAWVGLLVFENLKTMIKASMQIEGKGVIAEVCFRAGRYTPPPPSIIYPSFMQHIA